MAVARHSDNIELQELDPNYENDPTARPTEAEGHYDRLDPQTIDDAVYEDLPTQKEKDLQKLLQSASDESRKKNGFKAAAACLGVLCVILLAVNTGLGIRNSKTIKENNILTKMTKDLDHLQSKYDNLTKDRDHLQSKYDNLTKDQSRFNNITAERDELKRRLCKLPGWKELNRWMITGNSCYYISTEKKTWEESRKYCKNNQSDLIIINSEKEQDFVNRTVDKDRKVWLGLSDIEEKGVWTWVNGTRLTELTYWRGEEPRGSGKGKGEDCAVHHNKGTKKVWNEIPCSAPLSWICETVLV